MELWYAWKRWWRSFETSPTYWTVKRRIRQLIGTELRHFVEIHRPSVQYGEWRVSVQDAAAGGKAYSFGVGEDAILDCALIETYGFEVHAFDPTPRATAWVAAQNLPAAFHFYPVGVAGYDGVAEFSAPTDDRDPSFSILASDRETERVLCPVRKLTTLVGELGHSRIDLLKIDIEGAEYDVVDDLVTSDLEVGQLLVEFHHRFKSIGRARTARAVKQLREAGYRIFSISPSGREYGFIRDPTSSARS